jgi:hypothetical protein
MAFNTPWTRVDLETLTNHVIAGRTNAYIAGVLGRTISAIASARARPEVQAALLGKPVTSLTKSVASRGSDSAPAAKAPVEAAKPERKGKPWTEEENGEVIFYFAQDLPVELIAERMKRTVSGILARLKDYGLLEFNRDEMTFYKPATPYYKVKVTT